ncbi:glycosyltransferase family 4 protein [Perlabentimonas gracilis]|uniref:glycosyltransferase family 4 protein n=1 Tax=Perlabentimonas gracilis TaxID=2715279 RepID=UPI001408B6E0|nr:glycosyltransferase family 4 protein [Perlabentimonas gracilis]NHB67748.1 glycosyltransferase family 4 protein [Perlabentimonas gracilis]
MKSSPQVKSKPTTATIAMVVDNEFYGDIRVHNEATVLAQYGFNIKIFCLSFGKQPLFQKYIGIEVHRIQINRKLKNILFGIVNTIPLYYWFWKYHLKKQLQGMCVDAIHAHDLYMAIPARWVANRLRIPMILDLHENYPEAVKSYRWANKTPYKLLAKPARWAKLEERYLQMADGIVVLSENFADHINSKYPNISRDSIWIYPNVPDIDELQKYKTKVTDLNPEKNFNLLYFGGISERRGVYTCIKALELLVAKHSDIKLVLIGPVDGHEKNMFAKAIQSPQVRNSVIHIPWIDISELPSYINDCHICLSPIFKNAQHDSGVANKVFQYMTFSKPLIVSNCAPQIEVIDEANCGLVFESENAHDLAQKIIELYTNGDLCNKMGANGKRMVLDKYNTSHFGQVLADNYKELLGR